MSKAGRKAPPRQLEATTPWQVGMVYMHKGRRVDCATVQGFRYWGALGFLHRSPNDAMDRIEKRGPYAPGGSMAA